MKHRKSWSSLPTERAVLGEPQSLFMWHGCALCGCWASMWTEHKQKMTLTQHCSSVCKLGHRIRETFFPSPLLMSRSSRRSSKKNWKVWWGLFLRAMTKPIVWMKWWFGSAAAEEKREARLACIPPRYWILIASKLTLFVSVRERATAESHRMPLQKGLISRVSGNKYNSRTTWIGKSMVSRCRESTTPRRDSRNLRTLFRRSLYGGPSAIDLRNNMLEMGAQNRQQSSSHFILSSLHSKKRMHAAILM